jgi:AcrR family transcriptional regulator
MGIKERHERDREAVRRAILDAARELFVREGYNNVSIRKIAERIEYSPAAIYSYFPSKDDIFFELAEEGFRLLGDPPPADRPDFAALAPLDRIRAVFWRLYEFSRDQPQYFALMFVDRDVPRITREYDRFAFVRDMKARLAALMQECIAAKLIPASVNPVVAVRVLMMGLLGVAVMRLSDRLGSTENADDLARDLLDVLIAGLQSGIPLRSTGFLVCPQDERQPLADDNQAQVVADAPAQDVRSIR